MSAVSELTFRTVVTGGNGGLGGVDAIGLVARAGDNPAANRTPVHGPWPA